ncbi:MAG: isochorismatase family cysteine hydrolase [Janthinobacterium lividum]
MSKAALLLLDLQNEMVDPKGKFGGTLAGLTAERNVLANAATALAAARAKGMVVAFVRLTFRSDCLSVAARVQKLKAAGTAVAGTWGCEFPETIAPRDDEPVFDKQCVNPFFNTVLMTWLLRQGVERLVIGGVATNLVVEATARAADGAGFAVTVLEDVCAAPNPAWHEFSVKNMLPLFGTVSTAAEFAAG